MSKDFKEGYRQGYKDGWEAAVKQVKRSEEHTSELQSH